MLSLSQPAKVLAVNYNKKTTAAWVKEEGVTKESSGFGAGLHWPPWTHCWASRCVQATFKNLRGVMPDCGTYSKGSASRSRTCPRLAPSHTIHILYKWYCYNPDSFFLSRLLQTERTFMWALVWLKSWKYFSPIIGLWFECTKKPF